ncbi:hypothetical protein B9J78_00475 [bacterium Unc6]|nr:hypothetical protein [bacterium Unc6]
MKKEEVSRFISQLDDLLPTLIKHFQISNPYKLFRVKITLQQYLTLNALAKSGKCMVSELSKTMNVALSTMTELINRLAKRGFICKNRDIKDNRIVWVNLTNKGQEIFHSMTKKKQKHISDILGKLVHIERQTLIDILKTVSRAANEIGMQKING